MGFVSRIPVALATVVTALLPSFPLPGIKICVSPLPCIVVPVPPLPKIPGLGEGPPDVRMPSDVLDLGGWYLTLPTGTEGDPVDVRPPELLSFSDTWFRLNNARDGVVFTAHAGGVTTENSNYPRSELREMYSGDLASWSNESGTHTMTLRQAITRVPKVKPHVVSAQIHDSEDDVLAIRLEGERLSAQYDDGENELVIDPAYVLGTPYDLTITAANSTIEVSYNDRPVGMIPRAGDGWYFKTGSYVQSNPERGDAPHAVGEVIIYSLKVEHSQ